MNLQEYFSGNFVKPTVGIKTKVDSVDVIVFPKFSALLFAHNINAKALTKYLFVAPKNFGPVQAKLGPSSLLRPGRSSLLEFEKKLVLVV